MKNVMFFVLESFKSNKSHLINKISVGEISGSNSDKYEDGDFLRYYAEQPAKYRPMFLRNVLPSSSGP